MPEWTLIDEPTMLLQSTRQTRQSTKGDNKKKETLIDEPTILLQSTRQTRHSNERNKKRERTPIKDEPDTSRERKIRKKEEDDHLVSVPQEGFAELSAYEVERLENIRRNKAFLSSINLLEITAELRQPIKSKPSQRGLRRLNTPVKEVLPPRKSLRLQNKSADTPDASADYSLAQTFETKLSSPMEKPTGPLPMAPINMEEGSRLPSQLLEIFSEEFVKKEEQQLNLKEYCSALKTMSIREENVVKVVKERIFSAAFHPCSSSLLMATGDKWGHVGLWNLGADWGDDGVLLFQPHRRPIPCMAFSRTRPHLLSLSYEGSVRCMDVEKAMFDEVYDGEDGLKTFDFMSNDCLTLLVGDLNGDIFTVDMRTPGNSHESCHHLNTKSVRCVSVHPVQQQYFAVAESSVVSIYDSRCMKKTNSQPVCQLHGFSRSIPSALFSPCTGNRLLTTCMDDRIRIFDTSSMTAKPPLLKSIRHYMNTGRWLSKLTPSWDPKQEDCFVMGSLDRPRKMMVYHQSGEILHTFTSPDHISTVLSITAFHPTRNALLGGNASGRLHVLTDQM